MMFSSCSDDFVDVDSPDQNSEDFFNEEGDYFFDIDPKYFLVDKRWILVLSSRHHIFRELILYLSQDVVSNMRTNCDSKTSK